MRGSRNLLQPSLPLGLVNDSLSTASGGGDSQNDAVDRINALSSALDHCI